ncbi:MAG: GNVR domain-containing protein [Acidobacteriota bacterium]
MIEEKPLPWQELLEIFFRRRLLIVGLALAGFAIASGLTLLRMPEYNAKAKILLTEQAVSGPREEAMSDTQIKAELHHLKSPALIRAVLEFYQETGQPLRPPAPPVKRAKSEVKRRIKSLYGKVHDAPAVTNIDFRIQELANRLFPRSISGTNVIEISLVGSNPEWTAQFVNDLLDQHIKRIARFNEEARAGNFYLEQRNLLYVRWKEAQEALTEFRKRYGADLLSGDESHLRKVLSQLEANKVETETRLLEHQAKVEFLNQQLTALPGTIAAESRFTEDETVKQLKANILSLEMKRSELLSRYTPTSTRIRDIERQIVEARNLLSTRGDDRLEEVMTAVNPAHQTLNIELVQTEAHMVAAQARLDALDRQITDYRDKLNSLEMLATELQRLKNDVQNKQEAHQAYLQKEEEARFSSSLDESGIVNLSIFERAEVPISPEPSKTNVVTAAGAIIGLLLGVLFAFLRDFLDPSVKGSAQAFRLASTPIIAEVPHR